MKANELRINNWVGWGEYTAVVHELHNGHVRLIPTWKSRSKYQNSLYSQVNGIPLSEEWLLRLTFERYGDSNTFWKRLPSWHDSLMVDLDDSLLSQKRCWVQDGNGNIVLEMDYSMAYVHQLQNLWFAITGEELCEE